MRKLIYIISLLLIVTGCSKEKRVENRIIGDWSYENSCYSFKENGYLDHCYTYNQITWELSIDKESIFIDESLVYDIEPYSMKITKCNARKLWLKGVRDGEEVELKLAHR